MMQPRSLSFGRGSLGILKKETKYVSIYEKTDSLFIRSDGDGGMRTERDAAASRNGGVRHDP